MTATIARASFSLIELVVATLDMPRQLCPRQGDFAIFPERPISAACLVLAAVLTAPLMPALACRRSRVVTDQT